jgi:hypothetical protein
VRKVLLFALYILVVTPAGLAARAVRDPLRRRLDTRARSYWINTAQSAGQSRPGRS